MRIHTQFLAACLALAVTTGVLAETSHTRPPGWLWYHDPVPVPPKPPKPPKTKTPSPQPRQGAATPAQQWSTSWIRETLPKLRDLAVQDPTPINVKAYLVMQRVAVDRAQRFAEMSTMVTQSDPNLDENSRFPLATAAAQKHVTAVQAGLTEGIQEIGKTAGLFFFFRSDCEYCHEDLVVLRTLELSTGIKIVPISLDGQGIDDQLFPNYLIDTGQAARLGVRETPSFYLVRPPDMNNVVEIGQGYLSLDELEKRIVEQSYYRGWIKTNLYEKSRIATPMYVNGQPTGGGDDIAPGDQAVIEQALKSLPPDLVTASAATPTVQ